MGGRGSASRAQAEANLRAYLGGQGYEITTAREQALRAMTPEQRAAEQDRERRVQEEFERVNNEYFGGSLRMTTARQEREKQQARSTLASLKAPKSSRDSTTLKVGNREVVISKGTPGWTSSSWYDKPDLRRSRYTVRTTVDGAFGNTEFFDGPGGWKKAKAYAASHLGLGR